MTPPSTELMLPAPTATTIDRVRYLIKLFRKTQAKFGELINVDASNMSKFLSGRIPITDGFMNRIVVNFGVSKTWLATGEGVPFPNNTDPNTITIGERVVQAAKGAPVYDVDVTAGYGELSAQFTSDRLVGRLDMPSINPKYPVVHVTGESMVPRVTNNSWISIRPIQLDSPIFWGQMYLVVLDDYRMVKVLRKHPDPEKVVLHSYNPQYDDMEIPRSAIRQLFIVDAVLNYEIFS